MASPVEGWTEGRYKAFITSAVRAGFRRFPPKFRVLEKAAVGKKINEASGRMAMHYKCIECNQDYPSKEVQVDHKCPVVGPNGFTTWDDFINNLFCGEENLQVLCKDCHSIKTKEETAQRAKTRKKK